MTEITKAAETRIPIHNLLRNRWSPRAFSDRPVESGKLLSLFEAARWSPSSNNEQPWSFIVGTKNKQQVFSKLKELLFDGNRRWAKNAPVLILAVARMEYEHSRKPNRHAYYDVGQAIANLTVQASALGLSVHQMGGFDSARARAVFDIPDGFDPIVMIAVGYHDVPEILQEDLRQREFARRARKSLEEIVFDEHWGTSANFLASVGEQELPVAPVMLL